jgi:hypothetical protein
VGECNLQSITYVGLDFHSPIFVCGQFYVAVSRVTSVDNLKAIWSPDSEGPITKNIAYPEILITYIFYKILAF